MTKFLFRVEMKDGQSMREVDADSVEYLDLWLVFYKHPPEGGRREYWRARMDSVVSIETRKNG